MNEQSVSPPETTDESSPFLTPPQPPDATSSELERLNDTIEAIDDTLESTVLEDEAQPATAVAPSTPPAEFDPLQAFTSLLVGGAVEGGTELFKRLQQYEQEIQEDKEGEVVTDDQSYTANDLEWLRYTLIGFIFEQQGYFRRGLSMAARLANQSTNVAAKAAAPITNSRFANPFQRRYDRLVQRGAESVARWTQTGRIKEPESRELARKAYNELIDEFIGELAENEELQDLVTQQGLGLAAEVRDEVRERTVTGDNVLEGVVRRILRRTPREELPLPPEEVQKWAQFTFEDRKKLD